MEGDLHKAAMAHYEHLSMDQKKKVLRLFEEKDANGDRQVTLGEYSTFFKSYKDSGRISVALIDLFKHLDKNNDGVLDFEEFVACSYVLFNSKTRVCDACGSFLWGVYFVCVECYKFDNKETSYDLCCSCYRYKNFSHVHSYFLDTNALLRKKQCEDIKEKMEDMRYLGMTYYATLSDYQRQLVRNLFESLGANRDGKVSIQGLSNSAYEVCVELFDKNLDGTLGFEEFVTFYYMLKCRRLVYCDGCASRMLGRYFICVECYNVGKTRYDLCCTCYRNNNFNHVHSSFLDNYALLRTKPWEDNTSAAGKSHSKSDNTSAAGKTYSKSELEKVIRGFNTGVKIGKKVHSAANVVHHAATFDASDAVDAVHHATAFHSAAFDAAAFDAADAVNHVAAAVDAVDAVHHVVAAASCTIM